MNFQSMFASISDATNVAVNEVQSSYATVTETWKAVDAHNSKAAKADRDSAIKALLAAKGIKS